MPAAVLHRLAMERELAPQYGVQLLPFFRTIPEADRTFVELGALDGWHGSNTLMLERCFGWTGLLIEASPHNFRNLQRSGRRRDVH